MAGIKIPNLPSYGAIDTSKAKKDLLITTKNDGTYGTPTYPTNASKQLTVEELATMLPLPLNGNAFRLYDLGQTELVANTYNIIGNPATAPTVTTFTLPIVLPNKMLVAGVGATASPFIIEITGGYSGGSASNPITVQLTEVGDTVFFIGTDYGWQYVGSNKITDLTGYATESYVDAKVEDTIVNGVTDKAPSQNAVFDAIAGIPTPTLATVTTAGNTTTNDVTVGSATVSNATVSTLPFIDSAKKIISATGSLLGTWFQTLTAKSTPVDADTIIVNDSASSFEAKKTTALQFWTNYIKPKADATYNTVFTISNNAWVDLNSSGVGVLGRPDKPYSSVQACLNAIVALGNVNQSWVVNVSGDYTYSGTEYIYTPTGNKNNVTVIFNGVITTSIANATATRPYISQTVYTLSNWTWVFKNLQQTTNVGLISSNQIGLNVIIEKGTLKNGKGAAVEADYGLYLLGNNSSLILGTVTWDLNISAGLPIYGILTQVSTGCVMKVNNLTISGNPQATLTFYGYIFIFTGGVPDYVEINNVNFDSTVNYTNMNLGFTLCNISSAKEIRIGNVNQVASANLPSTYYNFRLLNLQNCKAVYVDNANLINRFCFAEQATSSNMTVGNIVVSGREGMSMTDSNLTITGSFSRTGADYYNQYPLIAMYGKCTINGGTLTDDKRTYVGGSNQGVVISYTGTNVINNTIIRNIGTSANSTQANSNVVLWSGNLILNNATLWTTNGNTNSASTLVWGNTNTVVEGLYRTNYYGSGMGSLTHNADVDIVPNLNL